MPRSMASVRSLSESESSLITAMPNLPSFDDLPTPQHRGLLMTTTSRCLNDQITSTTGVTPQVSSHPTSSGRINDAQSIRHPSPCCNVTSLDRSPPKSRHGTVGPSPTFSATESPASMPAVELAVLRELLDVPTKSPESSFRGSIRRKSAASRAQSPLVQSQTGSNPYRCLMGRLDPTTSRELTSEPKLVILSDAGRVLQYATDGSFDRRPEKILQLGPGSIAVASDAIPGKHWVLNIVRDARNNERQRALSLKSLRPRLISRYSDSKCQARELLLVFHDPFTFDKWLVSVRKEIETRGGLEYRPDSRGFEDERRLVGKASRANTVHFPSAPVAFPLATAQDRRTWTLSSSTSQWPPSAQSLAPSFRASITDSSKGSVTDLDLLRDSCVSDNTSVPTSSKSSYSEPVTADAAIPTSCSRLETNHGVTNVTVDERQNSSVHRRKAIPAARSVHVDARKRSSSCSQALSSPQFPRTPTLPTDVLHAIAGRFAPKTYTEIYSPVEATKMADWLANLYQGRNVPTGDARTPTHGVVNREPSQSILFAETHQTKEPVPGSASGSPEVPESWSSFDQGRPAWEEASFTTSSPSNHLNTHVVIPPQYNLAHRRSSSLDATQKVLRGDAANSGPIQTLLARDIPPKSLPVRAAGELKQCAPNGEPRLRSSQRVHRKNLSVVMGQNHVAIDKVNVPERSPAATDVHFATCFGVEVPFEKQSVQIDGELLDFPTAGNVIEFPPSPTLQQALDLPLKCRRWKRTHQARQKSLPNLRYGAEAPASPPPSVPLPPVPRPRSSTSRGTRPKHVRGKSASSGSSMSTTGEAKSDRRRNSCPRAAISPLSSNPPSITEKKYTGQLPAHLAFPQLPDRVKLSLASPAVHPTVAEPETAPSAPDSTVSDWPLTTLNPLSRPQASRVNSVPAPTPQSHGHTVIATQMEIKGYPFPLAIQTMDN